MKMTKQTSTQHTSSKRKREHEELLERAFARPGVREAMNVYDNWRERNRAMDDYREAFEKYQQITTTNSSNVQ